MHLEVLYWDILFYFHFHQYRVCDDIKDTGRWLSPWQYWWKGIIQQCESLCKCSELANKGDMKDSNQTIRQKELWTAERLTRTLGVVMARRASVPSYPHHTRLDISIKDATGSWFQQQHKWCWGWESGAPTSYSGDHGFKIRPKERLIWQVFRAFPQPPLPNAFSPSTFP